MNKQYIEFLKHATLKKEWVDRFIDPDKVSFARYDREIGYVMNDGKAQDGVDGSMSVYSYHENGCRRLINHNDRPCRMNSYGNSFTQCHQVNDGETWQEYLSAHLGEPIRNFGSGGYGVYHAYKRLRRHEQTEDRAPYILFNIWIEDHIRSINRWQRIHWADYPAIQDYQTPNAYIFPALPWASIQLDQKLDQFIEKENELQKLDDLYDYCRYDFVEERFLNDAVAQIEFSRMRGVFADRDIFHAHAERFGVQVQEDSAESIIKSAWRLLFAYGQEASMEILKKLKKHVEANDQQLMVLLSHGQNYVQEVCDGGVRVDEAIVKFLKREGFDFVDSLKSHVEDYSTYRGSSSEYVQKYYIGHYNPQGNHFLAFAMKNQLVDWLSPKPPSYNGTQSNFQEEAKYFA